MKPIKTICSIIIPCRNEENSIAHCIEMALKVQRTSSFPIEILIGDNAPTDQTLVIASRYPVKAIRVEQLGYGATLNSLVMAAKGEFIIMADGDGSYDLAYSHHMIKQMIAGADLVIGNRFVVPMEKGAMPWLNRYVGNPVLSWLARKTFGIEEVRDFHCGLRGLRRASYLQWRVQSKGMEYASEMLIKAKQRKANIREFPIYFRKDHRRGQPSKLRAIRDGLRHLNLIFNLALEGDKSIRMPSSAISLKSSNCASTSYTQT